MFPRMVEWRVANLPKPRFTTEESIHKRREADALSGQGRTVAAARFAALMGDPCSAPSGGWRFRLPDDATTSVIRMIDHASALRRTRSMDTTHPGSAGRASHGHCSHPPHRLRSRALSRGDLDEPQPDSDRHPTNGPNQAVRYAGDLPTEIHPAGRGIFLIVVRHASSAAPLNGHVSWVFGLRRLVDGVDLNLRHAG